MHQSPLRPPKSFARRRHAARLAYETALIAPTIISGRYPLWRKRKCAFTLPILAGDKRDSKTLPLLLFLADASNTSGNSQAACALEGGLEVKRRGGLQWTEAATALPGRRQRRPATQLGPGTRLHCCWGVAPAFGAEEIFIDWDTSATAGRKLP